MKTAKICKHCDEYFESRRSNHIYCSGSCKTKASYKRNGYKYVSGHYEKDALVPKVEGSSLPANMDVIESIKLLETKIESIEKTPKIDGASISNSAIGSAAADATVFAMKKLLAPNLLPATKGDVDSLKNELNELKKMIQNNSTNKLPFF
jgi:hypothetical protein